MGNLVERGRMHDVVQASLEVFVRRGDSRAFGAVALDGTRMAHGTLFGFGLFWHIQSLHSGVRNGNRALDNSPKTLTCDQCPKTPSACDAVAESMLSCHAQSR